MIVGISRLHLCSLPHRQLRNDTDEKAEAEIAKLEAEANKIEADSIATLYNLGFTDESHIVEYMKSKNLFGYAEDVSKSEAASYANETS